MRSKAAARKGAALLIEGKRRQDETGVDDNSERIQRACDLERAADAFFPGRTAGVVSEVDAPAAVHAAAKTVLVELGACVARVEERPAIDDQELSRIHAELDEIEPGSLGPRQESAHPFS